MYILLFSFLPIASEINLFGFSIKKEIQQVKNKLNEGIFEIKNQIIDLKISNSQNVYIYPPLPTPKEIEYLNREIDKIVLTNRKEEKQDKIFPEKEIDLPENVIFLFKTRWVLENILRSYSKFISEDHLHLNLNKLVNIINKQGYINDQTARITIEILNICNRGIHGEYISHEYLDFVKKAIPIVYKEINELRVRMGFYPVGLCPKCGYNGDLLDNNSCPKCGYAF